MVKDRGDFGAYSRMRTTGNWSRISKWEEEFGEEQDHILVFSGKDQKHSTFQSTSGRGRREKWLSL